MSGTATDLKEVRLLDFPLEVHQRTSEAFEGLRREFVLIALGGPDAHDVPSRLLRLVETLTTEFAGVDERADRERDDAIERGESVLDELVYRVPTALAPACQSLSEMLDEADEFCRKGDLLLSLASSPESVAFRRWILGEFVAQINGRPPLPWSAVDVTTLAGNPVLRGTG